MPRPGSPPDAVNRETDVFALGSTVYHIITGDEPFPDLDADEDKEEIQRLWQTGQFPPLASDLGDIARRC